MDQLMGIQFAPFFESMKEDLESMTHIVYLSLNKKYDILHCRN